MREYRSELEFDYQGKPAWTAAVNNLPHFVRLERGESMEQHLKKNEKTNYDLFEKVDLPKLLISQPAAARWAGWGRRG